MEENQLDPIDILIIKELTKDARISFVQLAKQLRISNTLVHQRVRKMRDSGVLEQSSFHVNPLKLGYETQAYTQIMLSDSKHHRRVERELSKIDEIVDCVNIAGRYALLTRIFAKNNRHLRDIIYGKILSIEGVEGTNTTICFETAFSRSIPLS